MALIVERRGNLVTTDGMRGKAPLCHTCKARKENMLFTIDPNGNPLCADCARALGRPID